MKLVALWEVRMGNTGSKTMREVDGVGAVGAAYVEKAGVTSGGPHAQRLV